MKSISILLILSVIHFIGFGQDETIQLQNEPIEFDADGFYIKKIVDARENKGDIGFVQKGVFKKTKVDAQLKGGVEKAVFDYLEENFDQDKNGVPIVLHITELKISESSSLPITGKAEVKIEFFRFKDGSIGKLYESEAFVEKPAVNVTKTHEERIREVVSTCIESFNKSDWKTAEPMYFKEKQ
ncbi:MAG: hypothetical protein ACOCVA_07965, partial [Prolixibacteraceae bacterium]